MAELQDGESVVVAGSTSTYTLERKGDVYSCTCPAWRNQKLPIADRVCKHLLAYLDGDIDAVSAPQKIGARPAWVPEHTDTPEVKERRRAALAEAVENFPVAFDKLMASYTLRLPKHVAYAIGWWNGMTAEERNVVGGGLVEDFDRTEKLPPECIPVFVGYGLWYDDPAELPRMVANIGDKLTPNQPTLLASLRKSIYDNPPEISEHTGAVLAWLDELCAEELAAYRDEDIGPFQRRADSIGGIGPWIPDWKLPHRNQFPPAPQRAHFYEQQAPEVDNWIARARKELDEGKPGFALLVGHDLHRADGAYRGVCTELLLAGYKALGREPMFELVRKAKAADSVEWHVLEMKYAPDPVHAQAIDRLMENGIDNNALDSVMRNGDAELVAKAFAHVDLNWRDDKGRSVLHHMVRRLNVEGVKLLLERGADGNTVDTAGETPYAAVAHVWTEHRAEADQMYAMLRAKGFGPKAKPAAAPVIENFKEGDRVKHAQYGEGVVKVSFGGKLTILFPTPPGEKSGMKTIAAKFVTRA